MINKRWQKSLLDVKVKRGADVGSDHHLIIALLRLKIKKGYMKNRTIKSIRFNVDRLKEEKTATQFSVELKNKFKVLTEPANPQENPSIQEKWNLIKESYKEVSNSVVGINQRQYKEWISNETIQCIKERKEKKHLINCTKSERQKDKVRKEYADLNRLVKKSARTDKRKFIENLAEQAETAAKSHDLHTLYKISRQVGSDRKFYNSMPIKDNAEKLLTTEHEQSLRWTEHFSSVLNRPNPEHLAKSTNQSHDHWQSSSAAI